ncbi:hypothetical protein BD779DRAFT_1479082 [Infundibulicybe gibba]|nr:hypothetical protein BD779DRAFT_1479082 [Infundibulicybe gibba]
MISLSVRSQKGHPSGFSPSKSGHALVIAMNELRGCLEATVDLLPDTLGKLIDIITQESSTLPCLRYIVSDFLLRKVLKKLPGAEAEHTHCKAISCQHGLQLVELSDKMVALLRVLGAHFIIKSACPSRLGTMLPPAEQIYESLYNWFLDHHQPKKWRPTYVTVHQYTWAWAWDTYTSQHSPHWHKLQVNVDFVHRVDLTYGYLRLALLEFGQPLNLILPPIQQTLKHAFNVLGRAFPLRYNFDSTLMPPDDQHLPHLNLLLESIEAIDFISMWQALPDLTTIFCPRLYYLHQGLDALYYHLQADGGVGSSPLEGPHRPIPHYQEFLEAIYSRLLQDPLASRAVPIIYAMFHELPPQTIMLFLQDLVSGEPDRSAAMQGLFGIGIGEGEDGKFISNSLGALLNMGRVKLRPNWNNESGYIDDCMGDAHEYLALSCAKHLESYTYPQVQDHWHTPGRYAREHWSDHLERAKPSDRLFEVLRRVDINRRDIEPVIQWLEASVKY